MSLLSICPCSGSTQAARQIIPGTLTGLGEGWVALTVITIPIQPSEGANNV